MSLSRIFAAIDLSEAARAAASAHARRLRDEFPESRVRWERPEKYHITLRFEARADNRKIEQIRQLLTDAAVQARPFSLELAGTGAFQNRRNSTVLWLGLNADLAAGPLFRGVADHLQEGEVRKFHPHVTVARLKHLTKDVRHLIDRHLASRFEPVQFTVDHLTLYESTLQPIGSVYSVLHRAPIKG